MEITYIIIAALIIILPIVLTKLLSGRTRQTKKVLGTQSAQRTATRPAMPAPATTDALHREVERLLAKGGKMEAIKLMRDKTGLGLAEAKAAVEAIGKGAAIVAPAATLQATIRRAQEMSDEVQHLVAQGQKIEAIKLIRERTGLGLKEAKDLVDRLG